VRREKGRITPVGGGYPTRPRRSAHDAIKVTHELLNRGFGEVVDADLSGYFDTIPAP
jgi:RNA-directed DNA polymerase